MKKYPLIEEFGLKVESARFDFDKCSRYDEAVSADCLEKLLSQGIKVQTKVFEFGNNKEFCKFYSGNQINHPTHTALVLNIKPIEKPKPVSKEELLKTLKDPMFRDNTSKWNELISRIESQGIE